MKLPNKYNYGTLFGFSGLEGENEHDGDLIGMTMRRPVSIRFDAKIPVTLEIPLEDPQIEYILCDSIKTKDLLLVFADKDTVLGRTDKAADITAEGAQTLETGGVKVLLCNDFAYALLQKGDRFVFCRAQTAQAAAEAANEKLRLDLDALAEKKRAYFEQFPACPRAEYERLYYKCLSINKVNVYSPQNGIDCRFTTPDRLPHHHMWLWDSMFHAMAFALYNPEMAKDAIRAVLQCQREDGFIPHMMKSKTDTSAITQPQVIAWAVLEVYRQIKDDAFLAECADKIAAFLLWFQKNRDIDGNGLLEWKTDYSNVRCRCDESGMDNSPRFDTTETLDAIDCNSFMVNDCRCLAEIYRLLGKDAEARRFDSIADDTAKRINDLLWDEERGAYCDRTLSGKLTGVRSVCSFLPLFAGVATEARAASLVRLLKDETVFATPLPVPSISRDHPDFGTDMWRGGVWLNFNYFVIRGLHRYGYHDEARELTETTLRAVNRWFEEAGTVFEFFDPYNETVPWCLNRKGPKPQKPDYRTAFHTISDYNWSACFTLLMLLGKTE